MSFPQFGEILEDEQTPEFEEFGEVIESQPSKSEKVAESFKFFGYKPTAERVEKIRKPVGIGLKGLTKGLLGTPGEIAQLLSGGREAKRLKFFGKEIKKILPTTEDIGNLFDKTAGEDFTPENTSQEFIDRGTEFLGSLLSFGGVGKAPSAVKALGKNLMSAFIPASVSLSTQKADLPPWLQVASTIGSAILTHKFTGQSFKQMESQAHKAVREISKDTMLDPTPTISKLEALKRSVRGRLKTDKSKQFLDTHIDAAIDKLDKGLVSAPEWMDVNTSLNEIALDTKELPGAKRLFGRVKESVQSLGDQMKRTNPKGLQAYREANSLTRGIHESRQIERWLRKNPLLAGHVGLIGYLLKAVTLTPKAAAGVGAIKVAQVVRALYRNQGLRKAYFEVLKNASKQDAKATLSELKKFNKLAEKEGIEQED